MPVATFPVHTKPKVCTIFTDQTSNFIKDKPHVFHKSTQYHTCKHAYILFPLTFYHKKFYMQYHVFKSQFYSTSMALFRGLGTISEERYCSQGLFREWAKSPSAAEKEECCTVLKVGKYSRTSVHELNSFLKVVRKPKVFSP